mgnify:CR=1 FL=1
MSDCKVAVEFKGQWDKKVFNERLKEIQENNPDKDFRFHSYGTFQSWKAVDTNFLDVATELLDPAEEDVVVVVVLTTFFVVFEFLPPFFDIDDDKEKEEAPTESAAAFEDKVVNILMSYFCCCLIKDDVILRMFVVK